MGGGVVVPTPAHLLSSPPSPGLRVPPAQDYMSSTQPELVAWGLLCDHVPHIVLMHFVGCTVFSSKPRPGWCLFPLLAGRPPPCMYPHRICPSSPLADELATINHPPTHFWAGPHVAPLHTLTPDLPKQMVTEPTCLQTLRTEPICSDMHARGSGTLLFKSAWCLYTPNLVWTHV